MKSKKTFNEFINTLKTTNRDWEYWTNYEGVIENFNKFDRLLEHIGVCDEEGFRKRYIEATTKMPELIPVTTLFSGIRTSVISVIEKDGTTFEFDSRSINPKEGIEFLEKVGFFSLFKKFDSVNLPSYFMGIEVGMDTNGRKNRGGKLMEKFLRKELQNAKNNNLIDDFQMEISFKVLGDYFDIEIEKEAIKNKRFDAAFMRNGTLYLCETNFFNSSGSKINETLRSFKELNKEINNEYECNVPVKFIYITDGKKLMSDKSGLEDTFESIEYIYNISDLEEGIFVD